MNEVGAVTAAGLALVFLWAAAVKLRDVEGTRASFRSLGLPGASALAFVVPCLELAVAASLLVAPQWGALAAICLLAAFTALLVRVLREGRQVACGCFGGAATEPIGAQDVVRNLGLLVGAVVALWATPGAWSIPAVLTVGAGGATLLMLHGLVRLRGELGVVWDNTLAGEPVPR